MRLRDIPLMSPLLLRDPFDTGASTVAVQDEQLLVLLASASLAMIIGQTRVWVWLDSYWRRASASLSWVAITVVTGPSHRDTLEAWALWRGSSRCSSPEPPAQPADNAARHNIDKLTMYIVEFPPALRTVEIIRMIQKFQNRITVLDLRLQISHLATRIQDFRFEDDAECQY